MGAGVPTGVPVVPCAAFASQPVEAAVDSYIHDANIQLYRHLIVESERNPKRDEDWHKMLLTLLAKEKAKEKKAAQ